MNHRREKQRGRCKQRRFCVANKYLSFCRSFVYIICRVESCCLRHWNSFVSAINIKSKLTTNHCEIIFTNYNNLFQFDQCCLARASFCFPYSVLFFCVAFHRISISVPFTLSIYFLLYNFVFFIHNYDMCDVMQPDLAKTFVFWHMAPERKHKQNIRLNREMGIETMFLVNQRLIWKSLKNHVRRTAIQ